MAVSLQRLLRPRNVRVTPAGWTRCLSSTRVQWYEPWEEPYQISKPERLESGPSSFRKTGRPQTQDKTRPALPESSPPVQAPVQKTPQPRRPHPTGVDIQFDGQSHNFSPILLRDLCACPQCLDSSTKQKFRPTTDIPASIKPRAVAQTTTGVSILWDNDVPGYDRNHTTDISADTLRDYVGTGNTGIANFSFGPRTLWDAGEYKGLPDLSYEEYMQSDSALYGILNQLHTHGLAFLTDVPESEKSVSTIAERIGPVKNTFYGYTWDVRSVPESKNVAYTSQDLGFHMDLLYMEQPPHLQFLHCIRSSAAGGASLFTDSYRAVSDLLASDVDAFKSLSYHPVNFHYNHPSSALYYFRRNVLEFNPGALIGSAGKMMQAFELATKRVDSGRAAELNPMDYLTGVAWSPPFQAPMGHTPAQNESRAPLELANNRITQWHSAAQKFNELIHRQEMIYERMMKPGECVLFDNRRVLHARKAFEVGDVGKERWLRGAYLDRDPYLSKMRVLHHQLGKDLGEPALQSTPGDYFEAAAAGSA